MKILLISQNFYPELGSASNRLGTIFKLLDKSKYDVHILTTIPTYPNKKLFYDNTYFNDPYFNKLEKNKIHRIITRQQKQNIRFINRITYFIEEFIKLRYYLKKHKYYYDYIYVTSPNIFLAWATLFFKKKHTKYILEIRDLWPESANQIKGFNIKLFMPILKYLEKKMYNSADKIVINNPYFYEHIMGKLDYDTPFFYLPNGIQKFEMQNLKKHNEFTVIYTGNMGHAQDLKKLVHLASLLNNYSIKFIAIIYGIKAEQFSREVKYFKNTKIKQAMPRQECLKEIAKAHVSLSILNSSEVFLNVLPGKVIDAISMSTIPVTNLGGYASDLIEKNKIGYAKKNASTNQLLDAIVELKEQNKLLEKYQANARNYAENNFIWENNIKFLEKFLMEDVDNNEKI